MARRRNSRLSIGLVIASALFLVGVALAPAFLDRNHAKPRLDTEGYLEDSTSFSGNRYFIQGSIAERLARTKAGAVYAVTTKQGAQLSIVIPSGLTPGFNIEKGQNLAFDIRVADDGSIITTEIAKQ